MQMESIDPDDLIGATKYGSGWRFFVGTVAEWILDYASYDPVPDPAYKEVVFRENLLVVSEDNAAQFLEAMAKYELSLPELRQFIQKTGRYNWPLSVLVDFDNKFYVNGFTDVSLHKYLPTGWKGIEGSPLDFVPDEIQRIWETAPEQPAS